LTKSTVLHAVPIEAPGGSAAGGTGDAGADDRDDPEEFNKDGKSFLRKLSEPLQKRSSSSRALRERSRPENIFFRSRGVDFEACEEDGTPQPVNELL
jgi:hypothetical protein